MNSGTVNLYAAYADKLERDPYGPDGSGRATVVNGRGFQKWRRFHSGEGLVSVHDDQGREWYLTPKQAQVYDLARTYYEGTVTMRSMAEQLRMAPSTISRAMWKLQAIGLLAFLVGRGRYAGMLIIARVKGDNLERFRKEAREKVREWSRKASERISRMKFNVALYSMEEGRGIDSLYWYFVGTSTPKSATLTQPWTADELSGIE